MSEEEIGVLLAWVTVGIGVVIGIGDVIAVWYFGRERRALKGNWVYESTWGTVWQITLVCLVLTVNRFLFLATNFQAVWMAVVTGVAAVVLLAIPIRKLLEFRSHEGNGGETEVQREDREAGEIRRRNGE